MPLIPVSTSDVIGYEFDGEDGCELCQATSGSYLDRPERPHENCDCEIVEITLEDDPDYDPEGDFEGDSEDAEIEVIVDSKSITTSEYVHFDFYTQTFANHSNFTRSFNWSWSDNVPYEADGVTDEIEDYCDIADLATDFDVSIDHDFELEAGEEAEIGVNVVFKVTEIELRLKYKNSETGEVVDIQEFSALINTPIANGWNINKF